METITKKNALEQSLSFPLPSREAYGQHWSPAEKGVQILYDLVINDIHKTKSGFYFENDKVIYAKAHPDL